MPEDSISAKHETFRWSSSLKGICHPFAHAQQFDFLSDGTISKLIYVREILFHRSYEACENSNTDIEELFNQPSWYIKTAYFNCVLVENRRENTMPSKEDFRKVRENPGEFVALVIDLYWLTKNGAN